MSSKGGEEDSRSSKRHAAPSIPAVVHGRIDFQLPHLLLFGFPPSSSFVGTGLFVSLEARLLGYVTTSGGYLLPEELQKGCSPTNYKILLSWVLA